MSETMSHRNIKYLGSTEINESLVYLHRKERAIVIEHGIDKILNRYGRSNRSKCNNYNISTNSTGNNINPDRDRLHAMVGRSPMSTLNDTVCNIKV